MSNQIHFIVNTDNPEDKKSSKANKKAVRAVAATNSWAARRQKIADRSKCLHSSRTTFVVEPGPSIQEPLLMQSASTTHDRSTLNHPSSVCLSKRLGSTGDGGGLAHRHDEDTATRAAKAKASLIRLYIAHANAPCPCVQCREWKRAAAIFWGPGSSAQHVATGRRAIAAIASMISRTEDASVPTWPYPPNRSPSQGRADPFNQYPIPYRPWVDQILHHSKSRPPFSTIKT